MVPSIAMYHNNSIKHQSFDYIQLNDQTDLLQTIQFRVVTLFSSTWPIDRNLSDVTTPGQIRPGSNGNEGIFHIRQISSNTGAMLSDCFVLYLWLSSGE